MKHGEALQQLEDELSMLRNEHERHLVDISAKHEDELASSAASHSQQYRALQNKFDTDMQSAEKK